MHPTRMILRRVNAVLARPAAPEWRAKVYRQSKTTFRRGHSNFHRSVTESARQLHRRWSRYLIERQSARSMDAGLMQWEPK